jgi:hypothetical protein
MKPKSQFVAAAFEDAAAHLQKMIPHIEDPARRRAYLVSAKRIRVTGRKAEKKLNCEDIPEEERFWMFTDVQSLGECWDFCGGTNNAGYGMFAGRTAHTYSYILKNGPISEGQIVRHKCDNKLCVNPEHLLIGTLKDNVRDSMERGLHVVGEKHFNARLTADLVRQIRAATGTLSSIAVRFGIKKPHAHRIRNRKAWAHVK